MSEILKKKLAIQMPDGSWWAVPVEAIARHRAKHYAYEFGGDIEQSLAEDTVPLFEAGDYEVEDWAANDMNWSDVAALAEIHEPAGEVDFQEGWMNGDKKIVD